MKIAKKHKKSFIPAREAISFGMFGDQTVLSRGLISPSPVMVRTYPEVQRELRDALAEGRVEARGVDGEKPRPFQRRKRIKAEVFEMNSNMTIDATNETTFLDPGREKGFPKLKEIAVSRADIESLWPKPNNILDMWMQNHAKSDPQAKRQTRIDDCRSANNCTHKEAREAFNRLPNRRTRGQRIARQPANKMASCSIVV